MRRALKGRPRRVLLLVGAAALAASLAAGSFMSLGRWLQRSDVPAPSDLIVTPCGNPARALLAARLYREGFAPEVWVGRPVRDPWLAGLDRVGIVLPPEEEILRRALVREGVPRGRIRLFGRSNLSTAEEALELRKALGRDDPRLIVATSRPHAPRTRRIFQDAFPGGRILAVVPDDEPIRRDWWRHKFLAQAILGETIKLVYYHLGGRFINERGQTRTSSLPSAQDHTP